MSYFLNLKWYDARLIKKDSTSTTNNFVTLYGTDSDWTMLWRPDIYMVNEIPSGILDFVPTDYIRVYENGTLTISTRHTVMFYCKIRLFKVPMTHETCTLLFQSNSHNVLEMNLMWLEGSPVIYSDDFVSLVSKIKSTDTSVCSGPGSTPNEKRPCISLALNIDQIYKGFIIQVYLPSTAILLMVWLGFWIHAHEVSSRVRVSTVAFTAMVTQMVGVMIVFPDTVELEPLLIWNGFCLCMNLLAFVEFIVVHNMLVNNEIKTRQNQVLTIIPPASDIDCGHSCNSIRQRPTSVTRRTQVAPLHHESDQVLSKERQCCSQINPLTIDKICKWIYVIIFAGFNLIYWSTFMVD